MKKKSIILLLSFIFIWKGLQAQNGIEGIVADQDESLIGATIILMDVQDSTLLAFGLSGDMGKFKIEDIHHPSAILQISYTGYNTLYKSIEFRNDKKHINLGKLYMEPSSEVITEISIEAERIPLGFKGDTIQYNVAAFNTPKGASVEDLLKRLPGIDVERDGTIKAQGEEVKSLTVDGQEFFSGDPKMATKNLDAEAVNKVQVFDKKSEEAEFTGIDDGEREKSINLELKDGMKNKNFGKIELAGGLDERHKGKLNFNRFNPAYQFSTILSGNNINENPLDFNEYLNSIGGLGQLGGSDGMMNELINNQNINRGIHSNYTGGINFSTTKWKNIKWYNNYKGKYHGSTLFENSDIIRRNPVTQWNEINESSHLAQNMSHSGFSKVKWTPSKQREISSRVAATYGARNELLIQDISFLQLHEVFNSQLFQNNTNFSSNNISAEINYRHKLKKKGRNFSLEANFQRGSNISEDRIVSEKWLSTAEKWRTSMLYQEQQVQSALNYTEPIKGPYFLKLQSSISSNLQAPQLSSFDLEGDNELINDAFSGEASRSFNLWNNRLHLKKQSKKWKYDIGLGHAMSQILLNVRDLQRPTGTKHYFLPSFSSKYKLKGMKNIRMDYRTSLRSPNVQQLASIPNRDNINRLELGNESLEPEYNHRLNISYNSFNNYNYASFFISMNYDYSPNKILQSTQFINPSEFITQSIHTENYHNASLTISKGGKTPLVRCKYNLSSSLGLAQYSNQINEIEVTSRPILGNISARIENRKKEKIDWMAGYELNLNYVVNDGGLNSKNTFTNHSWYLDIIWNISDSWEWRSKYDYSLFYNNGIKSGVDIHLLNFTLSKSFKDGKYTFNADVSDALNQRVGFEQIGGINNESTIRYNVLQRVVMLGFRYKI